MLALYECVCFPCFKIRKIEKAWTKTNPSALLSRIILYLKIVILIGLVIRKIGFTALHRTFHILFIGVLFTNSALTNFSMSIFQFHIPTKLNCIFVMLLGRQQRRLCLSHTALPTLQNWWREQPNSHLVRFLLCLCLLTRVRSPLRQML